MRFDNGSTPDLPIGNVSTPILLGVTMITSDKVQINPFYFIRDHFPRIFF